MSASSSKKRILTIGAGVGLIAALYFGWNYAGRETPPPPAPTTAASSSRQESRPGNPLPPLKPAAKPGAVATQLVTAEEGDEMIDEILRSDKEIPEMARDLHELVKKLNGEAQVNASQHLVNLTSDEDYGLISGFLMDPKMNPEVLDVLFSDLMNRDRTLQMPLFLNILRNPEHPQHAEVHNVMTILAGDDFGTDYAAWEKWAAEELRQEQEGQ